MSPEPGAQKLRSLWNVSRDVAAGADYALLGELHGAYGARSRAGLPALVIPLTELGSAPVGRRASGCELIGHTSTRLVFGGEEKTGSAAALICLDDELVDAFAVMADDVARRVSSGATWSAVLEAVEEWQTLLTPRGRLSAEREEGLWGELWFLSKASDLEQSLAGWCGPDADATDFFVGGKSVEIKTTRHRRQHYVSQAQIEEPSGVHEAWLLSIWVKVDPVSVTTVEKLASEILERTQDRGNALRRLARAGYSPADRSSYTAAFVVLSEPEWYSVANVPRVRAADSGISHLRYRVALDSSSATTPEQGDALWRHFLGHGYAGVGT